MAGRGVTTIITDSENHKNQGIINIAKKGDYPYKVWIYSKDLDDSNDSSFANKVRTGETNFHEDIKKALKSSQLDLRMIRAFKANNNLVWIGKTPLVWDDYNSERCIYRFNKNTEKHNFYCAFTVKNKVMTLLTVPSKTPQEFEAVGHESPTYYNKYQKLSRLPLLIKLVKGEDNRNYFEPVNLL